MRCMKTFTVLIIFRPELCPGWYKTLVPLLQQECMFVHVKTFYQRLVHSNDRPIYNLYLRPKNGEWTLNKVHRSILRKNTRSSSSQSIKWRKKLATEIEVISEKLIRESSCYKKELPFLCRSKIASIQIQLKIYIYIYI